MGERKRLLWFVVTRVVVVCILFAATTFLFLKGDESVTSGSYKGIFWLTLLTVVLSLLILLLARKTRIKTLYLSHIQLVWDLQYVAFLILLSGGIASPYPFLFLIVIIGASISLSRREAFLTAALCTILYGAILNLHYYGRLESIGLRQSDALSFQPQQILFGLFINILAFFLTALLSGYLAERVRLGETALRKREIDYSELQQLHSAIVSNLDSGLVTINRDGRIRVFNRYAEELTGIWHEDAYDLPLRDVLPVFVPDNKAGECVGEQREVSIDDPDKGRRVLEYKCIPITERDGSFSSMLIHFKELTEFKRLQESLRRADRLAAAGEMAARMAHEIRNPLAAINGSIQLIASGGGTADDQKLLAIVKREADRLNRLLTEFLDYTRQYRPQAELTELFPYFQELLLLIRQDERYSAVSLSISCPEAVHGYFDRSLIQQALWNLLANAADASPADGVITIQAERTAMRDTPGVSISITDSGTGISPEVMAHLYEPFYTSKPGGTGLGLATVQRIVAAHGGELLVNERSGGGTVVRVFLPDDPGEGGSVVGADTGC